MSISQRITQLMAVVEPQYRFITQSTYARRATEPGVCDFAFGNPHEMPLPQFVEALQHWSVPQNKGWFAYKQSELPARNAVAAALHAWRGVPFEPETFS